MGILLTYKDFYRTLDEVDRAALRARCLKESFIVSSSGRAQLKKAIDYIYNQMEEGRFLNDVLKEMEKEVGG